MARVELRSDLDAVVARMAAPAVNRLADAIAQQARERAPATKTWISREDGRVRPAHAKAHEQTIPENLRFKLPKQRKGGQGKTLLLSGFDLARTPRDPALPEDQKVRCRCVSITTQGIIARRILTTPAITVGSQVRAQVWVRFNRIVESEHGTDKDAPSRFLGGAVDAVAARLRARAR